MPRRFQPPKSLKMKEPENRAFESRPIFEQDAKSIGSSAAKTHASDCGLRVIDPPIFSSLSE
jgi:hypothetical protein